MLPEKIIVAHQNQEFRKVLLKDLCSRRAQAEIRQAANGSQLLSLQASFCADAVFLDMDFTDVPALRVIQMLKRDISCPYVLACTERSAHSLAAQALKMGANAFVSSSDVEQIGRLIGRFLNERAGILPGKCSDVSPEETLQRFFLSLGMPFSLDGYKYIRCALRLIASGESSLEDMGELYRKIALRFQNSAQTVDQSIRYALKLAWLRMSDDNPCIPKKYFTPKRFLSFLIEQPSGLPAPAPRKGISILRDST